MGVVLLRYNQQKDHRPGLKGPLFPVLLPQQGWQADDEFHFVPQHLYIKQQWEGSEVFLLYLQMLILFYHGYRFPLKCYCILKGKIVACYLISEKRESSCGLYIIDACKWSFPSFYWYSIVIWFFSQLVTSGVSYYRHSAVAQMVSMLVSCFAL